MPNLAIDQSWVTNIMPTYQLTLTQLILKTNTRFLIGIAKPIGKAKKGNLVNKMVKDLKIATKTLKQLFQMKALSKSQKP